MKRILSFIILAAAALTACNSGPDYKSVRQEVINIHDTVMNKNATLMQNKMQLNDMLRHLDSVKQINQALDTVAAKQEIGSLITELDSADAKMNNWMHHFEADASGKSNQEATEYFQKELQKVKSIDSVYTSEINKSNQYLLKLNGK